MRIILLTLLTLLQFRAFAHRENTYFLSGNFGDRQVGMRMDEFGEKCFIRYFEVSEKYDHQMEGDISTDGEFYIYTIGWNSDHTQKDTLETLVIKESPNHNWAGNLTLSNGEKIEVFLTPIQMDSLNNPHAGAMQQYVKLNLNPYAAYRSADIVFIPEKKERVGKSLKIQWYREKETGIRHFRILPDKKQLVNVDSINRYLAAEHIKLTELNYTCIRKDASNRFSSSIQVHYLNSDYLSYCLQYQTNCINMGEEKQIETSTFLIASAKEAMLEDIFWFGNNTPQKLRDGSQEWYQYRYKQFGQNILQLMEESHPKEMNDTNNGCNYKNLKRWQFPNWHLTKKGLFLDGYSLMEDPQCRNTPWSVLSWKTLKPFRVIP